MTVFNNQIAIFQKVCHLALMSYHGLVVAVTMFFICWMAQADFELLRVQILYP